MQLPPSEETDGVSLSRRPGPQRLAAIEPEEKGAASSQEEQTRTLSPKAMPTTLVLPANTAISSTGTSGANAAAEVNEDPKSNQILVEEGSNGFYTSMRALEDARLGDARPARTVSVRISPTLACHFSTTRGSWEAPSCVSWDLTVTLSIAVLRWWWWSPSWPLYRLLNWDFCAEFLRPKLGRTFQHAFRAHLVDPSQTVGF